MNQFNDSHFFSVRNRKHDQFYPSVWLYNKIKRMKEMLKCFENYYKYWNSHSGCDCAETYFDINIISQQYFCVWHGDNLLNQPEKSLNIKKIEWNILCWVETQQRNERRTSRRSDSANIKVLNDRFNVHNRLVVQVSDKVYRGCYHSPRLK